MNPEIGKIALMLLSLLIFAILVSGVCSFFANNVIRSVRSRSPKAILLSVLFEAVLVALALFVLSGIKETLTEAFVWLAAIGYVWSFVIATAIVAVNSLIMRLWWSRYNTWSCKAEN